MKSRKAIGILGGMGPEASIYMYKLLIDISIKDFGAKNNDDFPEIILHSIPVPDFISNDKEKRKALNILKKAVVKINNTNIFCLSIACNTAHILLKDLQKLSPVPFVSMIDEVSKQVYQSNIKMVGLLGTPSTICAGMYQSKLKDFGIEVVVPNNYQLFNLEKIIRNVIKGKILKTDQEKLVKVANSLNERGVEGIILGCTELPLVFPKKYSLPVYNSVEILARALLRKYYK